jgi:hypothetical protein
VGWAACSEHHPVVTKKPNAWGIHDGHYWYGNGVLTGTIASIRRDHLRILSGRQRARSARSVAAVGSTWPRVAGPAFVMGASRRSVASTSASALP